MDTAMKAVVEDVYIWNSEHFLVKVLRLTDASTRFSLRCINRKRTFLNPQLYRKHQTMMFIFYLGGFLSMED